MNDRRLRPLSEWLPAVRGRLIVSCQALEGEPLYGAEIMARMAVAAKLGGAVAIRANSPEDIRAIRQVVDLPIFGLYKDKLPDYEVYITPTLCHARQIAEAGADVICIDATDRSRPEGPTLADFIRRIKAETDLPVMADISTIEEALMAEQSGADLVSSTMSGYTAYSPQVAAPDLELVSAMVARLAVPVMAEGRYLYPEQAREALQRGAYAVIVGGAITRPAEITARFAASLARVSLSLAGEEL
jgi:N-acylglucosamine-6-phosphate 2-epimerase